MSKIDELLKNEKIEWKKLGDICEFKRGQTITKKDIANGNIPVIAGGQKPAYYHNLSNRNGITIAVSGSGAYAGFISYWEQPIFLSDAFSIEPNESLNKRYLYHWLMSIQNKIFELKQGSGIPHVYGRDLGKFEIPIPSIETQEKIVKTLDKFTNYVTELQAELQARTKQYEYYRDILLSEEYLNKISTKMYGLECKDYEVKFTTLGEIAQINRGASPRPITKYITDDIEGIPWIKIGDIGVNSKYVTKTAQKITVEGAKKSRILKKGDFIMSNSMSYGRPYILDIDGAIHDGWASISDFHNILDSDFLYYYLTSYKVQNYWKGKINSSSVSNLNSEIIRSLPIPVIDKELQQVVAKILDKFQSLLADTKGLLPQEIEQRQKQYEYYREKLLTFNENSAKHTHTHNLISNSYFDLLKEAASISDVKLFEVEWKVLGSVGVFENGTGMSKSLFDETGSVGAIHYGHIYTKYNLFVNQPIVRVTKKNANNLKVVNKGDLVIAKTSENIEDVMKTVAYLGEDYAVTGGHSAIFRHKENPKYLSYVFNGAKYLLRQKNKLARGVKVIELSITDMEKIKIPVPSIPVQEHIVEILDKFDTLVNDISKGLPKEIELRQKQYEYYREKLLSFEK